MSKKSILKNGKLWLLGTAVAASICGGTYFGNSGKEDTQNYPMEESSMSGSDAAPDQLGKEKHDASVNVENDNSASQEKSKTALEIPKVKRGLSDIRIRRKAYTVSYNKDTRLPNWVAWHLTRNHAKGQYDRNGRLFAEDKSVPLPRATDEDYNRSGYSRGHMCPSADNRWDDTAQEESFLYTNCCPQNYELNAGDWEDLESKCRYWAGVYGDVYIVCGPLLVGDHHKTIGQNKVVVPEKFFKVVLRLGRKPAAIGFVYNNTSRSRAMVEYMKSIDEVEAITGFDFFSALEDDLENRLEAESDLREWK